MWEQKAKQILRTGNKNRIKSLKATMERLYREQEGLKKEVVKAISGESDFDRSLLKTLLDENKVAQQETEEALQQAIHDNAFEEEQVKKLEYHFGQS